MELLLMIAIVVSIIGVVIYDKCEKAWRKRRKALRKQRSINVSATKETLGVYR